MKSVVRYCVIASILLLTSAGVASAQDFERSYRVGPSGSVSIRNVSGNVEVTGHDGDSVVVRATKEGEDRDAVEIEDLSAGDRVELRAKYPRDCYNCNASLKFEVRVPRDASVRLDPISTASGDIQITNLRGDVRVNTASGNVTVENVSGDINASTASGEMRVRNVSGSVNASSASGDVEVDIARLEGGAPMKFSSASGNVSVRLPSGIDADVVMSTASGRIRTDFPIEVRESRRGSGSRAEGRLGSGARNVRISTASGDVSLTKN
ncbi:MAG TPA: DUF4097 family beta strand repeat-containing protein [Pyrinomonadaceae bacterium]|nr:DUF4097 family beta strand repeat-containing protein [Pyrinomonadaceae bacterium]